MTRHPYERVCYGGEQAYTHRLVYEAAHGLDYLPASLVVHHIDGDYTNNVPENLRAMTRTEHTNLHLNGG